MVSGAERDIQSSQDYLEVLRIKYAGAMESPEFYTPDYQTKFWKDMFADDPSITVGKCDWTEEEMRKPMVDVKGNPITPMMVYKPDAFRGKEGLVGLGRRYPTLRSRSVQGGTIITDEYDTTGWVKVEGTLDAPNLNTTEDDLLTHLKRGEMQNYRGQRESTYIILGQALYVLTGKYPDLSTISRLPGSRDERRMLDAVRRSDGGLIVGWDWLLGPQDRHPRVGGRFEER